MRNLRFDTSGIKFRASGFGTQRKPSLITAPRINVSMPVALSYILEGRSMISELTLLQSNNVHQDLG